MATGTGPCRSAPADQSHQSPDELGEDDLNVAFEALHPAAGKYLFLGVAMNVKMNEIKNIQSQCSDPRGCLLEVLLVRLKQIPPLTWRDIDTALRSDTVGEPQLADRIRRQYGHLYSPDPSFEASLDQERGRKMLKITKSKKKAKKEKSAKKYMQQDSDEEVSESERYRKPSKKVQIEVNEAVVKKTQQKAKKSPYTKRRSKPEKEYIEETKREGETQIKKKATKYDKGSQVVCGSQHRHKVKHSEQRAQKEVQIESESESSSSSSEQEIVQGDNSDSTEESNSSEQEEDSAEEVSETERYQKPSEQPREDEYPHSHRETPVRKTKGKIGKSSDLEKSKFESQSKPEGKAKRKKKAIDQSVSNEASQHEMASDVHGNHENVAQERKQKKSKKHSKKGVQKAPRENESESSAMRREEERVSSSYHRGRSRKPRTAIYTHQQKQSQGKKLDYQTTAKRDVNKTGKESVTVAGEQSSDEEVREKPAPKSLRQKEEQTKSESEDESSSASTSDDGGQPHLRESTRMTEHRKVHPNTDVNEIEKERAVKTKKEAKVMKRKDFRSSHTDMREQSKKAERSTKVNQKMKKTSKEKYLKADTSPRKEREEQAEKERISSKEKVVEQDTPSSDNTQEDSKDKKSDSDDSSEDEEDRDSEQKSSNEEEKTEPDDESSPDTSEEEVKRKPAVPDTNKGVMETGERKEKRVKIAADEQDLPGDEVESDPGGRDQKEHDIQPKKRSRRRHRESSMSPTVRGSSSPSTSQEEGQRQPDPKEQKGRSKKGKDHKKKGKPKTKKEKGEASDSSPECDRSSESEKLRINVFECFYGQLCCEISNPVETAAQLQKKGLISKTLMRDIMRSPESQQEKTINLVDKLDEIIKSQPDCLFTFIEALLENEALQKVGSEILTEAGK